MQVDTGIPAASRQEVAEKVSRLLADTYVLYVMTHGYHWNVTGPMFRSLHLMFEEQYMALREAADVIAERIRALGHMAPGSYTAMAKLASVTDEDDIPDAMTMVRRLLIGHEAVIRTAREVVRAAEEAGDVVSADLATTRIDDHEKTAWMLRATAS
jgi:starvation-inducible DNA-binding protein